MPALNLSLFLYPASSLSPLYLSLATIGLDPRLPIGPALRSPPCTCLLALDLWTVVYSCGLLKPGCFPLNWGLAIGFCPTFLTKIPSNSNTDAQSIRYTHTTTLTLNPFICRGPPRQTASLINFICGQNSIRYTMGGTESTSTIISLKHNTFSTPPSHPLVFSSLFLFSHFFISF